MMEEESTLCTCVISVKKKRKRQAEAYLLEWSIVVVNEVDIDDDDFIITNPA